MANKTPILVTGSLTPSGSQDVNIVGSTITLAISAASLPLPTGAATEVTLSAIKTNTDKFTFASTRLLVDGSGVTQPISGSVAVSNFPATQPVSAVSLPLPTGAATETTLATLNTNVAKSYGTWSYYAGISGTVSVTAGQRVVGITAHATTAGSFTINGGTTITVPANASIGIQPLGNVIAPTIIFSGTDAYFIEVVV